MNVYNFLDLELTDRGWYCGANGQSVFYHHKDIELLLEPLSDGTINVLNTDHEEVGMIEEISELDNVRKYLN